MSVIRRLNTRFARSKPSASYEHEPAMAPARGDSDAPFPWLVLVYALRFFGTYGWVMPIYDDAFWFSVAYLAALGGRHDRRHRLGDRQLLRSRMALAMGNSSQHTAHQAIAVRTSS